jgi:hypothetical protein
MLTDRSVYVHVFAANLMTLSTAQVTQCQLMEWLDEYCVADDAEGGGRGKD